MILKLCELCGLPMKYLHAWNSQVVEVETTFHPNPFQLVTDLFCATSVLNAIRNQLENWTENISEWKIAICSEPE